MKTAVLPLPTSAEIDQRLEIVSQLRNLCLSLGRARPLVEPDQGITSCGQVAEHDEPEAEDIQSA